MAHTIKTPPRTIDPSLLMTMGEVCEMLGRKRTTIYLWRRDRDFPAITLPGDSDDSRGSTVAFELNEVVAWAQRNQIPYHLPARFKPTARRAA